MVPHQLCIIFNLLLSFFHFSAHFFIFRLFFSVIFMFLNMFSYIYGASPAVYYFQFINIHQFLCVIYLSNSLENSVIQKIYYHNIFVLQDWVLLFDQHRWTVYPFLSSKNASRNDKINTSYWSDKLRIIEQICLNSQQRFPSHPLNRACYDFSN